MYVNYVVENNLITVSSIYNSNKIVFTDKDRHMNKLKNM